MIAVVSPCELPGLRFAAVCSPMSPSLHDLVSDPMSSPAGPGLGLDGCRSARSSWALGPVVAGLLAALALPPALALTAAAAEAGVRVLAGTDSLPHGGIVAEIRALVAAGVVLWVLRSGANDDLGARCPFVDGAPACPDAESLRLAGEDRDRANLYQGLSIGAFAAGGVAITSGLLWYALGGRASERVTVSAGLRGGSVTVRW